MLGRLCCGLCPGKDEEEKPQPSMKARSTGLPGTPQKNKIEMPSTSQSSQRHLPVNQDTFEGFVESLRERESVDFLKVAMKIDDHEVSNKDFDKKLWQRLLFLEKMVSQLLMIRQISEIPNTVIRSWTTSEPRIVSVDPVGDAMRAIKERAKFLDDNLSYRRFLKGRDCIDKTLDLPSCLEEINNLKLYISKLCSNKSKYLSFRDAVPAQKELLVERLNVLDKLVTYFLVSAVCVFRFAESMTAFEVYEVKQSIEDVLENYASADAYFGSSRGSDKDGHKGTKSAKAAVPKISKGYLELLTVFHIQKSSNPDVETNEHLFQCYKRLQDESLQEMDWLGWFKDKDAFSPLQDFLVDQIQKRYVRKSKLEDSRPTDATADSKVFVKVTEPVEPQPPFNPIMAHSLMIDESKSVKSSGRSKENLKSKDDDAGSAKVNLETNKKPRETQNLQTSQQPSLEAPEPKKDVPTSPPVEPPKKKKKRKSSRTFSIQ